MHPQTRRSSHSATVHRLYVDLLCALALYFPFEDFILKWVPVSGLVLLFLRQIPDFLLLYFAVIFVAARLTRPGGLYIVSSAVDTFLFLFVVEVLFSGLLNHASTLVCVIKLKAIIRYVLVIYLARNTDITERDVVRFYKAVAVSVAIQVAIGLAEVFLRGPLPAFFLPRIPSATVAGIGVSKSSVWESAKGAAFGTMVNTIGFAQLLVVGLVVWMAGVKRKLIAYWCGIVVIIGAIYLSGVRAATIVAVLLVALNEIRRSRRSRNVIISISLIGFVSLLFVARRIISADLPQGALLALFTAHYYVHAMGTRLGVIVSVFPFFLTHAGWRVLLGLTPDPAILAPFIHGMPQVPILLQPTVTPLEDVYWIALTMYFGVVGVGLLLLFYFGLWKMVRRVLGSTERSFVRTLSWSAQQLLLTSLLLNFVSQTFEVRQFSFYLWTIVGFALSTGRQGIHDTVNVHSWPIPKQP